jgi:hypothetical protein
MARQSVALQNHFDLAPPRAAAAEMLRFRLD